MNATRHIVIIAGQHHYLWYMLPIVAAESAFSVPKITPTPPGTPLPRWRFIAGEVALMADRATRRQMAEPDLQKLVDDGEYASKGAARRALGIDQGLSPISISHQLWLGRLLAGLAGARPPLPNTITDG